MWSDLAAAAAAAAAAAIRDAGVCDGPDATLNGILASVGLADHHVHGHVTTPVDEAGLRDMLIESDRRSAADAAGSDTQVWHAIRRWCAPLLGLPAHAPAADYVAARLALGSQGTAERLLPLAGFSWLGIDTGFRGTQIASPAATGDAAGGVPANRIVRLEAVAELLVAEIADPWSWPDAFRAALAAERAGDDPAVGWKSILAYRGGFDRDLSRPADEAVAAAAARWAGTVRAGTAPRLEDPVLLRAGIWAAVDTGLPVQFHTGFGDPDLDLHRSDPLLLTDLIRGSEGRAPIVLLHTYPFQRGAGYLAQMFPHVYLDVGEAVNYTGAASEHVVRESMELAPFTKILFSSDAWGAPELHLLGSWLFRRAMSRVLGAWVRDGDWSLADAERVVALVANENVRRVYATAG